MSQQKIEAGETLRLDFTRFRSRDGTGVLPVAVQDIDSGVVLLIAHASERALSETIRTGIATFWSMSRNELWVKGATSGNTLEIVEIRVNCEQNSLLYIVRLQHGGACHTKNAQGKYRLGCYYRKIVDGKLVISEEPYLSPTAIHTDPGGAGG
jgi:phosphoribosyl-AMP cyclohydrolase